MSKYKYKGNVPVHIWDKEESFSVLPGDILELSFTPNKKFEKIGEEKIDKKMKKVKNIVKEEKV